MEFSYYPIIFGLGVLGDVCLEDISGQYSFYDYRILKISRYWVRNYILH
ncbi:hypothetical protein WUBG_18778 [Wuchereria bancrofti]|uniref:Uncharacterized protein n=1 Tax=Wuchereria bancrofti TaxID=6293 RepID=J9E4L0_WUCBA|nr:hypothetical protein WUBG_18778 [Wuchereria bancrofti]